MFPPKFEYLLPETLGEAVEALERYEDSHLLAGGQSLIPMMRFRLVRPSHLIDVGRISELRKIRVQDGQVMIGALVTYSDLQRAPDVAKRLPLLVDGASSVGDTQIRNRGTIGGALSHCDPAGDVSSCVLALRGKMVAYGKSGERTIESDAWFVDSFENALGRTEILKEIVVKEPSGVCGEAYVKFGRNAADGATVGVAVQLSLDSAGACAYAGIGLTGVGATNLRAKEGEAVLLGKFVDSGVVEDVAQAASDECSPTADALRGSVEYKRSLVKTFTKRALHKALERAGRQV